MRAGVLHDVIARRVLEAVVVVQQAERHVAAVAASKDKETALDDTKSKPESPESGAAMTPETAKAKQQDTGLGKKELLVFTGADKSPREAVLVEAVSLIVSLVNPNSPAIGDT